MSSIVMISWFNKKSDWVGVIGSGLCLGHCLALPLLFSWGVLSGGHNEYLEFGFLAICLGAVWKSSRKAPLLLAVGFWGLFLGMALGMLGEGLFRGAEVLLYGSSVGLVLAHSLNLWHRKNPRFSKR